MAAPTLIPMYNLNFHLTGLRLWLKKTERWHLCPEEIRPSSTFREPESLCKIYPTGLRPIEHTHLDTPNASTQSYNAYIGTAVILKYSYFG